ncbi:MAG: Ig-like domain-containing protein [Candidatus Enteromonas sp.]|nr:Ig-like domain-containing protein [Candidatus Enteromonas sp.]
MKRGAILFLSSFLLLGLTGCNPSTSSFDSEGSSFNESSSFVRDPNLVYVEEIAVSKTEVNLTPKKTASIIATVSPSNATNPKVGYRSEDPRVATVDQYGKITAVHGGSTRVIVFALDEGGASAYVTVNVNEIEVEEIIPSSTDVRLSPGESQTISHEIIPSNADDQFVSYLVDDESIVSFDSGVVTALNIGTTNGYIIANNGVEATIRFTVAALPLSDVYFESSNLDLIVGETFAPSPVLVPSQGTYDGMTYVTSDPSVVEVDGLTLKAKSKGQATITLSLQGKTSQMNVRVLEKNSLKRTPMARTYQDYYDNNLYPLDSAPCEHQASFLVIPVWFSDSDSFIDETKKETIREDISLAFFGSEEETGWHSVKSFYGHESHGRFTLNGKVTDWLAVGESASSFGPSSSGGLATYNLVSTAFDWAKKRYGFDPQDYDWNRDGYVDGIVLVYAAPDYIEWGNNEASNLWAYSSSLGDTSQKNLESPGPNAYFWGSYDFMYSPSDALEKTGKTSYGGGDTRFSSIDAHTFIHETGHMLGLPDYYDYSGQFSPLGGFSMQDMNVGGHDPYSILAFGWASPYIPEESCEITLRPFEESGDCVILSPSWNDVDSPFDEYLLLTYYTPTGINAFDHAHRYKSGYPTGPSSSGIALYHVDARLLYGYSPYSLKASKVTSDPLTSQGKVYHMMTNTYFNGSNANRISLLGEAYADYNVIQLIRNSASATYEPTDGFDNSDLFMVGESFDAQTFARQFKNPGLLNDSGSIGWNFQVESAGGNSITVRCEKE